MRVQHLTIPALAILLASCGGQKATNAASPAAGANAAASLTAPAPAAPATANAAGDAQADWQTTASGLRYRKISGAGTGPKPGPTDTVTFHYVGTLTDGTVFDQSRGEPVTFALPELIRGWQEGVPKMSVGDVYEFIIPPELGYGPDGGGPIPPNSTLHFRIGLVATQPG